MSGRSFEEEATLATDRYFAADYFDRSQFDTMVSQILAVINLKPKKILEVGPGNGFVSNFLRSAGFQLTTFDINPGLKPDVVGNIVEIDKYFEPNTFDLILCAEVLEHLPFEYFDRILRKYRGITSANVIITLPRRHRILMDFRLYLKVPFIKSIISSIFFRIPDRRKWEGHHWEIDFRPEASLKIIKNVMKKHFTLKDCFVDERVRHHQFFILEKFSV